jgi:glycosyltransferase involved in cell wall biosynthesis
VYVASQFSLARRKMGRQSASGGLLAALIASEPSDAFRVLLPPQESGEGLEEALAPRPELRLHSQPLLQAQPPDDVDVVFMSDPLLGRLAHWRQWQGAGARAYGLIGITHTLCSLGVLEGLRELASAPVQRWDALICTSRCAREAVRTSLAWEEERLRRRFGVATLRVPRPRLPLIPLGCDAPRLASLRQQRQEARQALRIAPDQVVLLFVGRLSVHAKAHPTVLLETLARVAARRPPGAARLRLLLYGTCPEEHRQGLRQALQALVRGYEVLLLDGDNLGLGERAWAAADIFVSLADNHQETFGLTPVEAMACGLPVIASDWNGYRDTVLHGQTGLLVPSYQPADGLSDELARYALGLHDYDSFVGRLMQEVVIDPAALAVALERLIDDPQLRRRLGEAGQQRALRHYDWPVIGRRIRELAASLEVARRRAPGAGERDAGLPPLERQFGGWASGRLRAGTRFGGDGAEARRRWQRLAPLAIHRFAGPLACSHELCELLLEELERRGPFSLEALEQRRPELAASQLRHAAHWLCKLGVLELMD